ncbi:MAG: ACP S-malonyltransferase [Alphaproteobacteria bacterium]|jgi:[acyl-carrier-protein] S-malonyltransferase|nr:[acyl-carrier-protein] S-malonyltransferase [Rhodospirillaceae bacterium]MDP6404696.1 ACP S-malonyltransferase [Alphaproteobacteria bacterium]MDP6620904.1 ACP S-malonyltransferase [Alphaproteobacteria bacterium]
MKRAFTFPGQGSQEVGMGRELSGAFAPARQVFEEVDEALKQNLTQLMFEGPEEELTLTENAQPALMAVSLATLRVLQEEGGFEVADSLALVAGHSLGEYSALAAAGALTLEDTARLLRRRGAAMQRAVAPGEGAMAALLGMEIEAAQDVAAASQPGDGDGDEPGICAAANDNGPGQVVISGHRHAVERAIAMAQEKGARRAIMLPVSAPFHCALMAPAAEEMTEVLAAAVIAPPRIPLVANVTAAPVSDPETIRGLLVEQITSLVRWRESVLAMREAGVEAVYELGSGRVLTGLARRIDRELEVAAISGPDDIEKFLKTV